MVSYRPHPILVSAALIVGMASPPSLPAAIELRIESTVTLDTQAEVTFELEFDKVIVRSRGAMRTCCHVADARLVVGPGRLEIHERDVGPPCGSVCRFDLKYSVWGLVPGRHEVLLFGEDGAILGKDELDVEADFERSPCRPEEPPGTVLVTAGPDSITVEESSALQVCSLALGARVRLESRRLLVEALELAGEEGELGSMDLRFRVPGLTRGDYDVQYFDLAGELRYEGVVTVTGPRTIVTQAAIPLEGSGIAEETRIYAQGTTAVAERWAFAAQCCLDTVVSVQVEPERILLRPEDRGPPCDCMGRFNLRVEVLDVERGAREIVLGPLGGAEEASDTVLLETWPRFVRGAVLEDPDELSISGAIRILGHLFLGEPSELGCRDAADLNDDGELDLSDPVALLDHLFLGGPDPPPPFLERGPDPTADGLDCAEVPCPSEKLVYELEPKAWKSVEVCVPDETAAREAVEELVPEADLAAGPGCEAGSVLYRIPWHQVERWQLCELARLDFIEEIRGSDSQ